MKKISALAVLAFMLVFGLALAGCKSEPDESPELTEIHVITESDMDSGNFFNYATTITAREYYYLRYEGHNPNADLTRYRIVLKQGATVLRDDERAFQTIQPKSQNFMFNTGSYMIADSGTYTIEVYVVDANGNKSNTVSVPLTVR